MAGRRRGPSYLQPPPIKPARELTEDVILIMAAWVKETTLLAGGSISTAYTCAGLFAQGLEQEMRRREAARDAGASAERGTEAGGQ